MDVVTNPRNGKDGQPRFVTFKALFVSSKTMFGGRVGGGLKVDLKKMKMVGD